MCVWCVCVVGVRACVRVRTSPLLFVEKNVPPLGQCDGAVWEFVFFVFWLLGHLKNVFCIEAAATTPSTPVAGTSEKSERWC